MLFSKVENKHNKAFVYFSEPLGFITTYRSISQ